MNKINENIKYAILAVLTVGAITVDLSLETVIKIDGKYVNTLLYLIFTIFMFVFYRKYENKYKGNIYYKLISALFSFFMTVGYSIAKAGDFSLIYGNLLLILITLVKLYCFYKFFYICINIVYELLKNYEIKEKIRSSKLYNIFNKHPFIFSFVFILICYIPYIIAFYPAVLGFDPSNQIKEYMGLHTRYMDSIVLINPNVTITNFNPVLHTIILGSLFKFGYSIGNVNLGLFMYSIIQIIFMISVLSYSVYYLKKIKINDVVILTILLCYSLIPVFPFYALSTNKDTIFSALILLYTIKLYDLIRFKMDYKKTISLIIILIFVALFRNNGIITIMLSLPFALFLSKDKMKYVLVSILAVLLTYFGYNKILLPHFKISNTSIREVLSIPFQQTARYIKKHPDDLSSKDKKYIKKVLDYDLIGNLYNPNLSDPVKNTYNKNATSNDLKNYFKVWYKGLKKHPITYIESTVNNTYGYFYPNATNWYVYSKYNPKLKEVGFNYHYNSNFRVLRLILKCFAEGYKYIPVLGLIVNVGFLSWIYIFLLATVLKDKKYKYIILLLPAISFILTNIASPANTYFRYVLPYMMSLPFVLSTITKELRRKDK